MDDIHRTSEVIPILGMPTHILKYGVIRHTGVLFLLIPGIYCRCTVQSDTSLLTGLTKPGEVGKILARYQLKSHSLDSKAKLKSPCFFLQAAYYLLVILIYLLGPIMIIQ